MTSFYDVLKREYSSCPPGCSACEDACAREKGGVSRIKSIPVPEAGFNGVVACNQCNEPACRDVCPTGAIIRSEEDGVVRITEEKCVGCALCTMACSYGGIRFSHQNNKSSKCDLCGGKPACITACPNGSLSLIQNRRMFDYFVTREDRLPHGLTACYGCAGELGFRFTMKVLGTDCIYFSAPGCGGFFMFACPATTAITLMTNAPSYITGVRRYYRKMGKDVKLIAYVGDGTTSDVGFQALSGAAERDENMIYICYDNEGYMNTGIQRSGTTPQYAWTTTSPVGPKRRGKGEASKYIPLLIAMHNVPYVATATVGDLEDYARKLKKAEAVKDGLAYIHLFSPCPTGWRAPTDSSVELSRMAVETNYFPLWEAERGKFHFTYEPKHPRPVGDFTKLMGRYSHLAKEELSDLQSTVDERFNLIRSLTAAR